MEKKHVTMTSQPNQPSLTTLRGTTMVVGCHIRFWRARVADKAATRAAASGTGADEARLSATKALIERDAIKPFSDIYNRAKAEFASLTAPWQDGGLRIIRSQDFLDLKTRMSAHEDAFRAAVRDFVPRYPSLREASRQGLGPLYDPNQFPHPDHVARRFDFEFTAEPLPDLGDWRVTGLSDADLDTLRQQAERATLDNLARAQADAWERLRTVAQRVAETLPKYTGTKEGAFRDSLIGNVAEVIDLLPRLNVTGDPRLDTIALTAKAALLTATPEDLREDEDLRVEVAANAAAIVASINDTVGQFI